ncbi:UPF0426 protein At1g28150, chloroplastic [Jatropha curcas]|uniref:UPF0426 protein At1g28150, chloroplastic n=1 Tax=Jatropha curcas TaxID=180498 RepID=UPI0005FC0BE6|nr:UPF0426 protein At1g28150, chloroplastic [Jatropha curcas]
MALSGNSPVLGMSNLNLKLQKRLGETHLSQWSTSSSSWLNRGKSGGSVSWRIVFREGYSKVKASCFFNPVDQPILKEAIKEPVAFMGGIFAGLLRLDLEEDPLKEWVTRTVEAAGITVEDIDAEGSKQEEVPQQIEIE